MGFEASPLNRVLQQAAPGNDWTLNPTGDDHSVKLDYQTNVASEVNQYTVSLSFANNTYTPTLALSTTNGGYYDINQLYKTITKDENWMATDGNNKTTEEFKDKEGRIVLKRTYSDYKDINGNVTATKVAHNTYYVYDSYGNLSFVLPPKAEGLIDITTLNNLCYQYTYDYRNRLVEKKLPGKDWEYIVYDKLDRPILTQDANLRTANKWMFTKYDVLSRPVYTGEYINTTPGQIARADVQNNLADASAILFETKQGVNTINGTTVYYSNNAFPNIINTSTYINLFTINYYDDYSFDLNGGVSETAYGTTPITNAKGLATGSKVRILGTTNWTTNVSYYDAKGRPIYSYSKNDYLVTTSKVKSQLDFPGKTLETTTSHTRASVTTNIVDAFVYDNSGRLLTQKQTINSQAQEVIVSNTYDNMGQLTIKGVGGKTTQSRLQNVDYTYNIRGWLKGINDTDTSNATITLGSGDLFGFQINYNNPSTGTPLYNGNISQTFWKTANTDTSLKNYTYTYDALNRLTNATDNLGKFNENLSYDKNGNITNLTRMGEIVGGVPLITNPSDFGLMDNLTYTYDGGNRLQIVSDSANDTYGFKDDFIGAGPDTTIDYTYDDNGNMKTDTNKGISAITYNYLNLPTQVVMPNGTINYVYDATGAKQQKIVSGITTDYAGGFNYEGGVMKFFSQPEGYVANNNGIFSYIYQFKDHLGNVRLSYNDVSMTNTPSLQIVEENNYYPFGLKQKGYNYTTAYGNGNAQGQKYKYNGKELQDELGLNLYDYGARNYDPALGRWMNIDPMAEKYIMFSPYNYVGSNPIVRTDPTGKDWFTDKKGNQTYNKDLTKDNASTILNKGQHYSGTTATEKVSNDAGNYTLTYNKDGSISSSNPTENNTSTTKATPLGDAGQKAGGGESKDKIAEKVTTGMDALGASMSVSNAVNIATVGIKFEGVALKAITGSGTVIGAIAGGVPAARNLINNGWSNKEGVKVGIAILGLAAEFTGLGETYDGTVGAAITVGSLLYDINSSEP